MYSTNTGTFWASTSTTTTTTSGWYWDGSNPMGLTWDYCLTVTPKKEIEKTQALDDFLDSFQKQ